MAIWGFDLDEVLCDFVGPFLTLANPHFASEIKIEDLKDYYINLTLGIDRSEVLPILATATTDANLIRLPVLLEGLTLYNKLREKGNKTYIRTFREDRMYNATKKWLEKHNIVYEGFEATNKRSKAESATKFKWDYFVEDNINHANEVAETGVTVFVPEYPWNIDKMAHHNVVKIKKISDIWKNYIETLA
jgi:uncharacterized HAD superfamily protein